MSAQNITNDLKGFFDAVEHWKQWMLSNSWAASALDIAMTKPQGAEHNSNWYMTADGSVWASMGEHWYIGTRIDSEPFAPYNFQPQFKRGGEKVEQGSVVSVKRPDDGTVINFVKKATDCMQEDWCWYVKRAGRSYSTREYCESALARTKCGTDVADLLLAKRVEVEVWIRERAAMYGPEGRSDTKVWGSDWMELIKQFAPDKAQTTLPDPGSVSSRLHMVLDELACGRQIRGYAY